MAKTKQERAAAVARGQNFISIINGAVGNRAVQMLRGSSSSTAYVPALKDGIAAARVALDALEQEVITALSEEPSEVAAQPPQG